MKVIIKSDELREEVTRNNNTIFKQDAALDAGDGSFPLPFVLTVRTAYKPGEYRIRGTSFRQGRFGGLEIDNYNIGLLPIAGAASDRKAG